MGIVHQVSAYEDGVSKDERRPEMIAREEIGSGEFIDSKGRLFLRSGMPEFSFTDEIIDEVNSMEDHIIESVDRMPKWKRLLIDAGIYLLLIGLVTLGIILSQSNQ